MNLINNLDNAVAIIGMSCNFPGSASLSAYWENLTNGKELITFFDNNTLIKHGVPETHINDKNYVKAAPILENYDEFDAEYFGFSEKEALYLDPQQRLLLHEVYHAVKDSGYTKENLEGEVGVFVGSSFNSYLLHSLRDEINLLEQPGKLALLLHANASDYLATRVAYKFNFQGPALTVQTACSSSLAAAHSAFMHLNNYECDTAIVAGTSVLVPQYKGYFYERDSLLSETGHCCPFDEKATGTIFGSGIGVVILKRVEDAIRDGNKIYALIRGFATNNDGNTKMGFTAPSQRGQSQVIEKALSLTNIEPDTISYIEAHGTGTKIGDPIEIQAIQNVFDNHNNMACAIGAVKANIGHCLGAAGIAGLIKTALQIYFKKLTPQINCQTLNKNINFGKSRYYINKELKDWNEEVLRAGISSFGIGGTNVHGILENFPNNQSMGLKQKNNIFASKKFMVQPKSSQIQQAVKHSGSVSIETIRNYFSELLGKPDIQMQDNFFELGGHSLLATQLLTRIDSDRLTMQHIYENPTPEAIAKLLINDEEIK